MVFGVPVRTVLHCSVEGIQLTMNSLMLILVSSYLSVADYREKQFTQILDDTLGKWPLDNLTNVDSVSLCAVWCLTDYSSCESFLYDPDSQTCMTGSWLVASGIKPGSDMVFYSTRRLICDLSLGYSLVVQGTYGICVYLSPDRLYYNDALNRCVEKKGRRIIIKTRQKKDVAYDFLVSKGHNVSYSIWVGLNYNSSLGSFVWADGSAATATEVLMLFTPGQPSYYLNETCVVMRKPGFDDIDCTSYWLVFCEYII